MFHRAIVNNHFLTLTILYVQETWRNILNKSRILSHLFFFGTGESFNNVINLFKGMTIKYNLKQFLGTKLSIFNLLTINCSLTFYIKYFKELIRYFLVVCLEVGFVFLKGKDNYRNSATDVSKIKDDKKQVWIDKSLNLFDPIKDFILHIEYNNLVQLLKQWKYLRVLYMRVFYCRSSQSNGVIKSMTVRTAASHEDRIMRPVQ